MHPQITVLKALTQSRDYLLSLRGERDLTDDERDMLVNLDMAIEEHLASDKEFNKYLSDKDYYDTQEQFIDEFYKFYNASR